MPSVLLSCRHCSVEDGRMSSNPTLDKEPPTKRMTPSLVALPRTKKTKSDKEERGEADKKCEDTPEHLCRDDECRKEQKRKANEWAMGVLARGLDSLIQEYKVAPSQLPKEQIKVFLDHPAMNRYDNIPCLDVSRVKVPTGTASDYIHANYVGVLPENPRAYICAQGPLDNTKERFWRMVINENVEVIVMLCELVEKNREKCAAYFPSEQDEKLSIGPVTITCVGRSNFDTGTSVVIVVRSLAVVLGDKTVLLRHFCWLAWPDHGVPTFTQPTIRLMSQMKNTKNPVVIHCSAGVGRTGTLAMMALAQDCLKRAGSFEGVPWLLAKVREQRAGVVQNDAQYMFVYRCLIDYLVVRGVVPKEGNEALAKFTKDCEGFVHVSRRRRRTKKDQNKEPQGSSKKQKA